MKTTAFLLTPLFTSIFFAGCQSTPVTSNANTNVRPAATVTTAPTATPDEHAAARATYAQFCIRCHKPDGSGGIFELEDGTKLKVPSFREGHALKDPDEEFVEQIMKGGDGMPAFKNKLEPERIDALVRFIRHEFQGRAPGGNTSSNKPMPQPAH